MTPGDVRSGVYRYIFNNLEYMDKKKYKHGFLTRAAAELVKVMSIINITLQFIRFIQRREKILRSLKTKCGVS